MTCEHPELASIEITAWTESGESDSIAFLVDTESETYDGPRDAATLICSYVSATPKVARYDVRIGWNAIHFAQGVKLTELNGSIAELFERHSG